MQKKKIFFLVGPTGVGKTAVSLHLAKRLKAEIISCDSMQLYKGMDIINQAPGIGIRNSVKHHLLRFVEVNKEYDVSQYRRQALKIIRQLQNKGKAVLLVGGSGLYMSILIDGIFPFCGENKSLRKRLYKMASRMGSKYLHARLEKIDPQAAEKIHPNDTKRIIRAIEVFEATGKPISLLQKQRQGIENDFEIVIAGLDMERENLYSRIESRVDRMFRQGAIKEVKKLLEKKLSRTASAAIGIKELQGFFCGGYSLDEAKRLMKLNTRRYAKRQLTWFRKDKRIHWLRISKSQKPSQIAEKIWKEHFLSQ